MSEVKLPTVGRIVHFFLVVEDTTYEETKTKIACNCHADKDGIYTELPAVVVQCFGVLHANLHVHTMCGNSLVVPMYSVPHKSEVLNKEGKPYMSYWDYPVIR